jgi:hypothetical protein
MHVARGCTVKLARLWTGPYRVIEVMSRLVLHVQHVNSLSRQHTIHVQRVKPCVGDETLAQLRSDPDESNADEQLEIDTITDDRVMDGQTQYRVRFAGRTSRYDAWVNDADLHANELLPCYLQNRLLQEQICQEQAARAVIQRRPPKTVTRTTTSNQPGETYSAEGGAGLVREK